MQVPGWRQAVQGQREKEQGQCRQGGPGWLPVSVTQPGEGQPWVTCICWSRTRLLEGSAELETVETGRGGR